MKIDIKLPELGEDIAGAVIAEWRYKEGDRVDAEDDIVEVVTDKAVFNISADNSGILCQIIAEEGQNIKVGEVIAVIET